MEFTDNKLVELWDIAQKMVFNVQLAYTGDPARNMEADPKLFDGLPFNYDTFMAAYSHAKNLVENHFQAVAPQMGFVPVMLGLIIMEVIGLLGLITWVWQKVDERHWLKNASPTQQEAYAQVETKGALTGAKAAILYTLAGVGTWEILKRVAHV